MMRILFLSNFYPPVSRGGYEQWCQEVADGLVARGHEVTVLTSDYRRSEVFFQQAFDLQEQYSGQYLTWLGANQRDYADLLRDCNRLDEALALASSAIPLLEKAKANADEVRLSGMPGDEIAAYAKKNLDVLLVGSHGYGRFKTAVLGSVATRIAARCDTPLLIVRA